MNLEEIKTLIDLCPGTRLPIHEFDIFRNKKLTSHYLIGLCMGRAWYEAGMSTGTMAYNYARHVMKSQWEAAEPVISKELYASGLYNDFFDSSI